MLTGQVNQWLKAVFPIVLRAADGGSQTVEAVLDTGFSGALTLPPALISQLRLPWRHREISELADGTPREIDIYSVYLEWDGAVRTVPVHSVDAAPLLGTWLLVGYEVNLRYTLDGEAVIRRAT